MKIGKRISNIKSILRRISSIFLIFVLSSVFHIQQLIAHNDIQTDKLISENATKFHLVYFMDKNCPACKFFSKTLKQFAKNYKLKVFAYDLGEEENIGNIYQSDSSGFEKICNKELLHEVSPYYLPTLIVVDNKNNSHWVNIAENIITFQELKIAIIDFLQNKYESSNRNS